MYTHRNTYIHALMQHTHVVHMLAHMCTLSQTAQNKDTYLPKSGRTLLV